MRLFILIFLLMFVLSSCGGKYSPEEQNALRAMQCPSVDKTYSYDEIAWDGVKGSGQLSFSDFRDGINSACMSCHQAPAQSGGFSYIDSYRGEARTIAGKTDYYPGFFEIAEKVSESILHGNPEKRMPPEERRRKNPEAFISLGNKVKAWIAAGKPNGSFSLDPNTLPELPRKPQFRGSQSVLTWSGGSVRVADLVNGMFGKKGENLKTFDSGGKNYAPQYLFWMAMEGTRVQFPTELSSYLGKHGAQMLNQMREKCLNQISTVKTSTPLFMDHEIFNKVCFVNNLNPGDPALAFDPNTNKPLHPAKVEAWLDRAAFNIGYALFYYLKDISQGVTRYANDQCEIAYPKKENNQ